MTTNINLDVLIETTTYSQADLLKWCFANLTSMTWGLKSISGMTHIYFDDPKDAEKFAEYWSQYEEFQT